jgi:uncharacterized protein with PIN domain
LVAFVLDEPAAPEVDAELRRHDRQPRINAINLAEVVDVLTRRHDRPIDEVLMAMSVLTTAALEIVSVDSRIGLLAGELRSQLYDRARQPLSLADCVALATAITVGDHLATSDEPLARAALAEGVEVLALPNANGDRPMTG